MNRKWHNANPLGKRASMMLRTYWHREHKKHCACRPIPDDVQAAIDEEDAMYAQPIPKKVLRSLEAQIRDMDDPTRYMIVTTMGPRSAMYYRVDEDVYTHNGPAGGTLFKRRKYAVAVASLVGDGMQVVKVRVGKRGKIHVLDELKPRWPWTARRRRAKK